MLRPESLLIQARQALHINVRDESVRDAERVDRSLAESDIQQWVADMNQLDMIRDNWNDIVDHVKGRRRVAWMLLSKATPESIGAGFLVIRFERDAEAKGFVTSGYDAALVDTIAERHGIDGLRVMAMGPTGRYKGKLPERIRADRYLSEVTDESPF